MISRSVFFATVLVVILPACVSGSKHAKYAKRSEVVGYVKNDQSRVMYDITNHLEATMEKLQQTMQMMEETIQMQKKMADDVTDQKKRQEKECPSSFTGKLSTGSCYQFVPEVYDWAAAQKNCRNLDNRAHLVVIDDEGEMNVLKSVVKIKDVYKEKLQVWTAGQRKNVESFSSEFVWKPNMDVGGENVELSYSNWYPTEPNSKSDDLQACLTLLPHLFMLWNDNYCDGVAYSVCEIEL